MPIRPNQSHQTQSEQTDPIRAIRANQSQSEPIRANQSQSDPISHRTWRQVSPSAE